jgi:hypothetical protein
MEKVPGYLNAYRGLGGWHGKKRRGRRGRGGRGRGQGGGLGGSGAVASGNGDGTRPLPGRLSVGGAPACPVQRARSAEAQRWVAATSERKRAKICPYLCFWPYIISVCEMRNFLITLLYKFRVMPLYMCIFVYLP